MSLRGKLRYVEYTVDMENLKMHTAFVLLQNKMFPNCNIQLFRMSTLQIKRKNKRSRTAVHCDIHSNIIISRTIRSRRFRKIGNFSSEALANTGSSEDSLCHLAQQAKEENNGEQSPNIPHKSTWRGVNAAASLLRTFHPQYVFHLYKSLSTKLQLKKVDSAVLPIRSL